MLKNFFKELKTKDWALLIMTVLLIIFSSFLIFKSTGYKSKIKELHDENAKIENQRKVLAAKIKNLKEEAKTYKDNIDNLQKKIDLAESKLKKKDEEITQSKRDLNRTKQEYEKNKKEIQKLEDNPIKRTGSDLLNSLKEKTK